MILHEENVFFTKIVFDLTKVSNSTYLVKIQLIEIERVTKLRKIKILLVILHKKNCFSAKINFDHYSVQYVQK